MSEKKIVLAYSGGLDTSVAIPWLQEKYGAQIIAYTTDLGMVDLEEARQRALKAGAIDAVIEDARDTFVKEFIWPGLKADAVYEEQYPLATAFGRPLIARAMIEIARREGAFAIAHGCTGKGNDQVRFDVTAAALAPDLKVIAPAREWGMTREQEIEYARQHGIAISARKSRFSIDENLWGRSVEAAELEDPWAEPPEDAFLWTRPMADTPDRPLYLEIGFQEGIPASIDGEEMEGVALINHLHEVAGEHGVGRIDHVENRLVGIKSREIYEAPAAAVLLTAHKALEAMTLAKDQLRMKARVAQDYADLVYNGLWFTRHREDLDAYVESTQRYVTGTVRVRLHKGTLAVVGRQSPYSLYEHGLATYGEGDVFDQRASEGFIRIFGLPVRVQGRRGRKG